MVSLTPELAGNSLVVLGITYVVMIAFSLYQLWLNWKQSKVKDIQEEQTGLLIEIRDLLKRKK